jgi:hypothetical protein
MKDLLQNILSNPIEYPYVPSYARIAYPHAPVSIEADSPFDRVGASGVTLTGDNYLELAELAAAEFRKVFEEIAAPGFSWDLRYDLEGNEMNVQVHLTHANGLPGGALPPMDHPTNALWDALGMGYYDQHNRAGNDTEVRFWIVNLDEQFS